MNLDTILDSHELWLETNGEQGAQANLSDMKFSGDDLKGRNLIRSICCTAIMRACDLTGTIFTESDMRGVEFIDCIMDDAMLDKCRLGGTVYKGSRSEKPLCFCHSDMYNANIMDTEFTDPDFEGAEVKWTRYKDHEGKGNNYGVAHMESAKNARPIKEYEEIKKQMAAR